MSHLQRYPLWKTCWKHKAFSIPLYQTKVEHESKKNKSTLWWRWITSTYSSSYSLEGVLYSCFLTWGIWTVQVISLPTFHGSIHSIIKGSQHTLLIKKCQLWKITWKRTNRDSEKEQDWQLYSPYFESGVVEESYIPGAPLPFKTWSSRVFDVFAILSSVSLFIHPMTIKLTWRIMCQGIYSYPNPEKDHEVEQGLEICCHVWLLSSVDVERDRFVLRPALIWSLQVM